MPITETGQVTIQDSAGNIRAYDNYYDRTLQPFNYTETLDSSRGRTKVGTLVLVADDDTFVEPLEDQIIKVYRDVALTDLLFGGVISQVNKETIAHDDSGGPPEWIIKYSLKVEGYDPYTLKFRDVVDYERIGVKAGQALIDLLSLYAPWINTTNIEVATSPLINKIHIERRDLASVINSIIDSTDWTFYIDDLGNAYFNDKASITTNWDLTEGTYPDIFDEFAYQTLKPESNVSQSFNDATLIGGDTRAIRFVEVFEFNGQEATKPLKALPYGLDKSVQVFDKFDGAVIDQSKWFEDDVNDKITESLGRLQISSLISGTGIIVSNDEFSRDDNSEVRFAEVELVSFGSGKLTVGVHNGTKDTTSSNFLHALEFDSAAGVIATREGSTVTTVGSVPIDVGIYSVRIRIKPTGGAIYFVQGGRTATPKEYGELGSKTWTKVAETGSDTTPVLALGIYADSGIGATVIVAKASKQIDINVTLLSGGKLGDEDPVAADTVLLCGTEEALDFETDCFVQVGDQSNPILSFFTDNIPLGTVKIEYFGIDQVRERVYDSAAKAAVDARSALTGDDGTRSTFFDKQDYVHSDQDARDLLVKFLADAASKKFKGQFETDSARLSFLVPVGTKPIAGQLLTISLPNTYGIDTQEQITSVTAEDQGGEVYKYSVQFGPGLTTFERFVLKLQNAINRQIIDTQDAVVTVDSEDSSTAGTARPDTPKYTSSYFDDTGLQVVWSSVTGATQYELRDNLYVKQGQGGSLIYQKSGATSFAISDTDIMTIHKKRKYTFYIWSIDASGRYSKYPLAITVENPAPEPQPIRDLILSDIVFVEVDFNTEFEADIISRSVQYAKSLDMTDTLLQVDDILTTAESTEVEVDVDENYYFRYGLKDHYTDALNDIIWSGIRQIKTTLTDGIIGPAQNVSIKNIDDDPTLNANEILIEFDIPASNSQTYYQYAIFLDEGNTVPDPDFDAANSSYTITGQVGTGQLTRKSNILTDTTKSWPDLTGKNVLIFSKRRPTSGSEALEGGIILSSIASNTATQITLSVPADSIRWSGNDLQYLIYDPATQQMPWDKMKWFSGAVPDAGSVQVSGKPDGNLTRRRYRAMPGFDASVYVFILLYNYWGAGLFFISSSAKDVAPGGPPGPPGTDSIPRLLKNHTEQGLVNPIGIPATKTPDSTNTSTDTVTINAGHGYVTGVRVQVSSSGGGLSSGTDYYVRVINSTDISFYPTVYDAYQDTNKLSLTSSISAQVVPDATATVTIPDTAFPAAQATFRNEGGEGNWLIGFHGRIPTPTDYSVKLGPGEFWPLSLGEAYTEEEPPTGDILVRHDDPTAADAGVLAFYAGWNDGSSPLAGPTGAQGDPGNPGMQIGYIIADGSIGTNTGPVLPAPRNDSLTKCTAVVKTSGAVDFTFDIKKNGVSIFTAPNTVTAGAAANSMYTFTNLTTNPLTVSSGDLFTIDITSGNSSWQVTVILR